MGRRGKEGGQGGKRWPCRLWLSKRLIPPHSPTATPSNYPVSSELIGKWPCVWKRQ